MRHFFYTMTIALLCLLSGCIRQKLEDCPPLRIHLEVKDKNYFNIEPVETVTGLDHWVDENLPFSSYIGSLYYVLYRQGETAPCMVQHLYEPQEELATHELLFPQELPFGEYTLVVWGNMDTEQGIEFDGQPHTYRLHGEHREGYDVYMGSLSLTYNEVNADYVLPLERVKGKLLVEVVGMPGEVSKSHKEVDHLYEQVNAQWQYTGSEEVLTEERWKKGIHNIMTDTYLSPTDGQNDSRVCVTFVPAEDYQLPLPQPAEAKIRMKRNEITVLRYVYDTDTDGFDIYLLVEDGWLLIHDMGIEE